MRDELLEFVRSWNGPYDERYFALRKAIIAGPAGPPRDEDEGEGRATAARRHSRPASMRRRGRPKGTGTFATSEELQAAIASGIRHIRSKRQRVTQERVAEEVAIDVRNLRKALRRFGLDWVALRGAD